MCHAFLADSTFHDLLFRFDQDLAASVQAQGCRCGGVLHSARYPRKPRGVPRPVLGPAYETRLSFCCAQDGCRRRTTPPSVRFLGRRVYLAAVVVLASVMVCGLTAKRLAQLQDRFQVSGRTLRRWRQWWQTAFVGSAFWRHAKGRLRPPVDVVDLPASLLNRFTAEDEPSKLVQLLCFLSPLSMASCVG